MNSDLRAKRRRRRRLVGGLAACLALSAALIQFGWEDGGSSTGTRGKQARPIHSAPSTGGGAASGSLAQADKIFRAEQSGGNDSGGNDGAAATDSGTGGDTRAAQPESSKLDACYTATGKSRNLITELSCTERGIVSLDGIQDLPALEKLDLTGNNISDLTPLAGLTRLKSLDLTANKVHDIGPLADLTTLTKLTLSRNRIEDLAPLADLSSLVTLELTSNRISYLDDLSGLTGLTYLEADGNEINDVSPLSHLANLTFLNLSLNDVTLGVRNLETLTEALAIQLVGNDKIVCGDLDALEDFLGPGILLKPESCLPQ